MESLMRTAKRDKIGALVESTPFPNERQTALAIKAKLPVEQERLTESRIKTLPAPATGYRIYRDAPNEKGNDHIRGFGLLVTASGAKSFVLRYTAKSGRESRYTIGSPPEWSLAAARSKAKDKKREIDGGADPVKDEKETRAADNVNQLCDQFLEYQKTKTRPATDAEYRSIIKKYVGPELGTLKVGDVQPFEIDRLHRKITATAPYRANRTISMLHKMFALAMRWKLRSDNPCQGVEKNDEHKRERLLTEDELARLHAALDGHSDQRAANLFRLLLLSGARLSETLNAEWTGIDPATGSRTGIDFDKGTWIKPAHAVKQKRLHKVPLSSDALALLRTMRAAAPDAKRLFEGAMKFRWHWEKILEAAGLLNLRIHDLRHQLPSQLASDGTPALVIAGLLGHSSTRTTERYMHLFDKPLRQATERGGTLLAKRQG
jgi:integrase